MARCIPDYVEAHAKAHPEVVFLERLKNELPDDFIIIPSLEIVGREDALESEADFILLHPRGRLVMELKGGTLRRVEGHWQRRKGGAWVPERKSPFYQSRANSHAVRHFIEHRFGKSSPEANALYGRVVVFPDAAVEIDSIEAHDQMILDQSDLAGPGSLLAAVLGLLEKAEQQFREGRQRKDLKVQQKVVDDIKAEGGVPPEVVPIPLEQIRLPEPLTKEQVEAVAHSLRPDLLIVPNLTASEVERELVRLSVGQLKALDAVQGSKRLRVLGGPGSGKTLLAVETARRELRADRRAKVGIVCFNRSLGSFLADVVRSEGLLTVAAGSFYVHVDRILGDEGRADGDSAYYAARVQAALEKARGLPDADKFDVLVVDEGQDFRGDTEKLELMDALLRGGLTRGIWRWFEDLDQVLTPPAEGRADERLARLTDILDQNAEFRLSGNWRNTSQIAQRVDAVMRLPHEPTGAALEGPDVGLAELVPGREFEVLDVLVRRYLAADIGVKRFNAGDVVILSMRGAGKASFEGKTEVGGFPLIPYDPLAPHVPGAIRATSVFKFKGMESHVVILTDVDSLETLRDRRKAYVGMSRARYKLFVLASPAAKAHL